MCGLTIVNPGASVFNPGDFLHPRFWTTWLLLGLMWLVAQLPFRLQLGIGGVLGRLIYIFASRRRHIAETNIALAFPDLSAVQRHAIVKTNFQSTGISLIEIGLSWWGSERRLTPLLHVEGLEHIHAALKEGKGVMLLGGHFTCLIIAGRLLALKLPFNILIKKSRNRLFEAVMHYHRSRQYQGVIDITDMRTMLKAFRNNQVCWYAPDQDLGAEKSVFAPFMGIQTATLKSTAKLAKATDAPVVYIDFERLPVGQGYKLSMHPSMQDFPSGDEVQDARRVNELIERHVYEVPDQYLWIHRRFKTRPEGEPELYGKKGRPHRDSA